MLKQRARLASAAAPGPTGHNSAAHPAAAPSAEAAPAAAQTHAQSQVTQDSTPVFQTSRASGDAAVTPARSARQHATPLVQSRAKRACVTSAAARRPRSRAAADDVDDTSGSTSASSYAPSTADGAPEPGSDAGDGPRAGGASHVATARGCWLSGHGGRELWAVASAAWARQALLRALTNTDGHAGGALCPTCVLARRWHGIAQPRCAARARGVARRTRERRTPICPPARMRRGGLRGAARDSQPPEVPPVPCPHQVPSGAAPRRAAALVLVLPQVSCARGVQRQPPVCACPPCAGSAVLTHKLMLLCNAHSCAPQSEVLH